MNSLIIISTPAGGKGTISEYIKDKYGYDHISVGDLLRDEVELGTEVGLKIKSILAEGKLVDDNILFNILESRLKKQEKKFVLDGTPRILRQAIKCDELLEKMNIKILKAIFIKTDKNKAEERMLDRLVCDYCNESYSSKLDGNICKICKQDLTRRDDDNIDIFEKRYQTFVKETLPVVEHYKEKGLLFTIDNNNSLEDVFNQVDELLGGTDK